MAGLGGPGIACPRDIGEDPAAHGHWCTFTDLYHAIPYHTVPRAFGRFWPLKNPKNF